MSTCIALIVLSWVSWLWLGIWGTQWEKVFLRAFFCFYPRSFKIDYCRRWWCSLILFIKLSNKFIHSLCTLWSLTACSLSLHFWALQPPPCPLPKSAHRAAPAVWNIWKQLLTFKPFIRARTTQHLQRKHSAIGFPFSLNNISAVPSALWRRWRWIPQWGDSVSKFRSSSKIQWILSKYCFCTLMKTLR